MDLVFNELSAQVAAPTITDSRESMAQLLKVVRQACKYGSSRTLRTTRDLLHQPLARGYLMSQWLNDCKVDIEQRRFFKAIATKAPYLEQILGMEEDNQQAVFEFLHNKERALGLGVALLWESPALSLPGDSRFANDPVAITVRTLDETRETEQQAEVCCLSTVEQVVSRKTWLKARIQRDIRNGSDLWRMRHQLFPQLIFCASTERQITNLHGQEPYFQQVCRHLFVINTHFAEWTDGPLELQGIAWSEESKETLGHPQYGPTRRFVCPDGVERMFSLHSKPTGGTIRIYFLPIPNTKQAYVGYIGPHLPTIRYRT
jgi:hypothetical protein